MEVLGELFTVLHDPSLINTLQESNPQSRVMIRGLIFKNPVLFNKNQSIMVSIFSFKDKEDNYLHFSC